MWLVACSDIHAGSTVAVFPQNAGIVTDDGQPIEPSKLQIQLHEWWLEGWGRLSKLIGGEPWQLALMGDLFEGHHHRSHQNVDPLGSPEFRACHKLLRDPLSLHPEKIYMVRGTEAHVGQAGHKEETMARILAAGDEDLAPQPIVPDPDIPTNKSAYWFRAEIEGHLIDLKHHGRFGGRAHTKDPYLRWYAHDIWESHVRNGDRPPSLAIRGHNHQYGDSGFNHEGLTRVVACPCWQMQTSFIHRISIESLPSIGLVAFDIRESRIDVHPILFKPERPTVCQ